MDERFSYGVVVIGVLILIIAILFGGCGIRLVGAGKTGVVRSFGKVQDEELSSGMHWVKFWHRVKKMSVRTEEYTMSSISAEGDKEGDDSISALTKEGLRIDLDLTVLYRLLEERASDVYRDLGDRYIDKVIRPVIRGNIRQIVAKYNAKAIYSDEREAVETAIFDSLVGVAGERGILIEKVVLRNVKLPPKLSSAIETKLEAEQAAQAMEFVLDKERQDAERKRIEAEGIRDAQEIIAAKLTPEYLRWYSIDMMKGLANSPNTTFLFVPIDKGGMPIINISK